MIPPLTAVTGLLTKAVGRAARFSGLKVDETSPRANAAKVSEGANVSKVTSPSLIHLPMPVQRTTLPAGLVDVRPTIHLSCSVGCSVVFGGRR